MVHQFVSIGHLSTMSGDGSIGAVLNHMRKFEPNWETLPETSFGLKRFSWKIIVWQFDISPHELNWGQKQWENNEVFVSSKCYHWQGRRNRVLFSLWAAWPSAQGCRFKRRRFIQWNPPVWSHWTLWMECLLPTDPACSYMPCFWVRWHL